MSLATGLRDFLTLESFKTYSPLRQLVSPHPPSSPISSNPSLSCAMAPPPTPARLSSLSTKALSQILELTRSVQEGIPSSPSLPATVSKNLAALRAGINTLDGSGENREVLKGLRGQYDRLVGLVEGLGVHLEEEVGKGKGKTGVLVDAGEEPEEADDG